MNFYEELAKSEFKIIGTVGYVKNDANTIYLDVITPDNELIILNLCSIDISQYKDGYLSKILSNGFKEQCNFIETKELAALVNHQNDFLIGKTLFIRGHFQPTIAPYVHDVEEYDSITYESIIDYIDYIDLDQQRKFYSEDNGQSES